MLFRKTFGILHNVMAFLVLFEQILIKLLELVSIKPHLITGVCITSTRTARGASELLVRVKA